MKKVLISSVLVSVLAISIVGCGSSSSSNDEDKNKEKLQETSYTPDYLDIPKIADQNISLDGKEHPILEFNTDDNISFRIVGGSGLNLFEIEKNKLYYRGDEAGEFTLKIKAHDNSNGYNGKPTEFKINVIAEPDIDTDAPKFTIPTTMKVGEEITLKATNESDEVEFSTTTSDFTINGSILKAPDTAGDYNITIKAIDSAGNESEESATIVVVTAEDNNTSDNNTTDNNNSTITDKVVIGGLTWTPIKKQVDGSSDSGKQTQAKAKQICEDLGLRLPKESEIDEAIAKQLLENEIFMKDANISSFKNDKNQTIEYINIWLDDDGRKYFINKTDSSDSYATDADDGDEEYYSCVK